jgi:hypothetical protein
MSQSKTICPLCGRPPGGVHGHGCPRCPERLRALDAALARPPRGIWPGKDALFHGSVAMPTKLRPKRRVSFEVFNPGVPMVKPPKPWTAGGLPRHKDAAVKNFYMNFVSRIRGGQA